MANRKRVLVTGHNGYLGSIMAPHFAGNGFDVVGLDTGYFDECAFVADRLPIPSIRKDIRDLELEDLRGFYAVVHLAALSNDPIGNLNEHWTEEINFLASVRLAELAKASGVQRFLFSSSCIMYGLSQTLTVDENSPLAPGTTYARSKVKTEEALFEMANDAFSPVFLRNGTVYGVSPRMRFDTVFNNFMGSAVSAGKVVVYSDGTPWRPIVHVQDVARAFLAVLGGASATVHNQAFNIGADHLNYQIGELARIAVDAVPEARLEVVADPGADQRTYRTDFSKFARSFPDFVFHWTPRQGALELREAFEAIGLNEQTFTDKRFTRLKWIRYLLDSGRLDDALRWQKPQA